MKPIKLELVLENCETIVFDWKHVNGICIADLTTTEQIDEEGVIEEYRYCKEFFIDVDSNGGEYEFDNGSEHWGKRLKKYADITQIHFVYADNSRRSYHVKWPRDGGYSSHPWQGVEDCRDGYTYIWCNEFDANMRAQMEANI
jgi:hypothetical protein